MDFKGQQLSEQIFFYLIIFFGSIGWVYGWYHSSFYYTFLFWLLGTTISIVLAVPDWPMFNRHPVQWLSPLAERPVMQEREAIANAQKAGL
ncbi:hypothetical protein ScalyP_jg10816 [Parmales sp. scaly parma]|nr:hypothetical protein ScalyP_jg10816 [Parmales sp. scaly parma]